MCIGARLLKTAHQRNREEISFKAFEISSRMVIEVAETNSKCECVEILGR